MGNDDWGCSVSRMPRAMEVFSEPRQVPEHDFSKLQMDQIPV